MAVRKCSAKEAAAAVNEFMQLDEADQGPLLDVVLDGDTEDDLDEDCELERGAVWE